MLKKILTVIGVLAVLGVTGPATATAASATQASTVTVAASQLLGLTSGQANAVRQAKSYLRYSGFSRIGLIDQLKYEGYRTRVATFAVDYIDVSWKYQAFRKAKSYLDSSAFSLSGLIGQLEYEGFTHRQARYGANRAY